MLHFNNASIEKSAFLGFLFVSIIGSLNHFFMNGPISLTFAASALGLLSGLLTILVLFYTYSGILGFTNTIVDIAIFYISVFINFYIYYRLVLFYEKNNQYPDIGLQFLLLCILILLTAAFFIFTFYPPVLGIFQEP